MKAMILAAGLGKRLLPLTQVLPKPLFPILNRPVLEYTLALLKRHGIEDVIANVHHFSEKIVSHFGLALNYSREENILGTAGGIKKAQSFLDGGPFIVINGDILSDIDLQAAIFFHRKKNSKLTLVVRQDENPEKYPPIEIDETGRIVRFPLADPLETHGPTRRVMFSGVQILEPEIFSRIPSHGFYSTTQTIYPEIINETLPVFGYLHSGYWRDIGTRSDFIQTQCDLLDGTLPSYLPLPKSVNGVNILPPVILGKHCMLSPHAQIGPYAVFGDGCKVEAGAFVERSVCWNSVTIGSGATVQDSILGTNVILHSKQKVIGRSAIMIQKEIHFDSQIST